MFLLKRTRGLPAQAGMTLIDVLVGTAVALMIFLAVYGLLRASAQISTLATETAAATAIANSQMEYIRSLPYDSVGTVGGIPAGSIPQTSTTVEDNISYGVRTFIDYYDDPADGTGASDTNGITTDYKRAKVTVSFTTSTGARQVSLVTDIVPPGIESTTGGGTLKATIVNASGAPVAGAAVRVSASTTPLVDVTTYSDATGVVYLPGAMPATGYHVLVTKSGYSFAQTYDRDSTNQNPNPGHLTVVKNTTTSGTFAIDVLASLLVRTFSPIAPGAFSDSFNDASKVTALVNAGVSGGTLTNTPNGAGGYLSPASARSTAVSPAYLSTWTSASATLSAPAGTSALVHIADGSGNLLPDAVVPGNSTGFSTFPIDLSGVATSTYPSLSLVANLSAGAAAPAVLDWTLAYTAGPVPLPNISFTLTGAKTIGSTGSGSNIYKTVVSTTTDATGARALSLEWDAYGIMVSGYTIQSSSIPTPFQIQPGTANEADIILSP